jgi:Zn-dependent peptidase ImmA (M78 family)
LGRYKYYEKLKALAREERSKFGWSTPRILRSHLRSAYKFYGIRIDLWSFPLKVVRGAYFYDEIGASVLLNRKLPDDPFIFTMAHELKHHLVDRNLSYICCSQYNEAEPIEIGAEIFAAELLYPEKDFAETLLGMGVGYGQCTAELLVKIKHETRTTLSYSGLAKRAVFLGFAEDGAYEKVSWKKLEELIYGEPIYKQIQRYRQGRQNF